MQELLRFLNMLEEKKIYYQLNKVRDEAIMVEIAVPGQHWEVEFMEDGSIEIEKFISPGEIFACKDISNSKEIDDLFRDFSD
ncbi:hypothetical protein [Fretibacterium sp. OH1220_COT-178]|uniref:hypothetical protein n=1 Tax=Fretibacterium sp. OH1220_COT-178 TaxID=2491047 RepID=UPI000F5E4EAC|nr:hypothetical protein [Fretibacterium sp. OH1220_COT-178]RRD62915.1 hypothetical protein EII26_12770 [Fretibacterium sp. OH1220_COT-178]